MAIADGYLRACLNNDERAVEPLRNEVINRDKATCLITGRRDFGEAIETGYSQYPPSGIPQFSLKSFTTCCSIVPIIRCEEFDAKPIDCVLPDYADILRISRKHFRGLLSTLGNMLPSQQRCTSKNLLTVDLIVSGYFQSFEVWLVHRRRSSSRRIGSFGLVDADIYTVGVLNGHVAEQLGSILTPGQEILIPVGPNSPSPQLLAIHAFFSKVLAINRKKPLMSMDGVELNVTPGKSLAERKREAIQFEVRNLSRFLEKKMGGFVAL
ncbi:hypothetical protein TWF718_003434 [Orbilia javanica]|uniref:Uncharacterized protein n=1 Tax=Orbilia javanica TaxID=47235 RepID=A0AAN8MIP8_9PEZI